MSKQRMVNVKFWDDTYVLSIDPIEKLLFLYLLTNPLTNLSGIYEVSLRRIAFDTGIDSEMVVKMFKRFEKDKKIIFKDGWVYIVNFVKNQSLNPSVIQGIKREIDTIPDNVLEQFNVVKTGNVYNQKQIPSGQRKRILVRDNYTCQLCKSKDLLEIDHIIPVYAGGENEDSNLRVLCRKCNLDRNKEYFSKVRQALTGWDRLSQEGTPNLTKPNLTKPNLTKPNLTKPIGESKTYFYKGQEAIKEFGKWYIIEKGGKILFTGNEKEIILK